MDTTAIAIADIVATTVRQVLIRGHFECHEPGGINTRKRFHPRYYVHESTCSPTLAEWVILKIALLHSYMHADR